VVAPTVIVQDLFQLPALNMSNLHLHVSKSLRVPFSGEKVLQICSRNSDERPLIECQIDKKPHSGDAGDCKPEVIALFSFFFFV